jgi:hypothetical protein
MAQVMRHPKGMCESVKVFGIDKRKAMCLRHIVIDLLVEEKINGNK